MFRRIWAASLFSCAIVIAQDNTGGTSSGGQQNSNNSPQSNIDRANATLFSAGSRPSVISGRVLVSDGSTPAERARIQRVCGVSTVQETYSDSQGRFSLVPGSTGVSVDASANQTPRGGGGGGGGGGRGSGGNSEANLWGCELRASLRGYRTESVPLGVRHDDQNRDVGAIILRPLSSTKGLTMSATSGLAPKEAQKSYEKGLDAVKHNQPDIAQEEFSHAMAMYARFAAAWYELGQVMERRGHPADARSAYSKAAAADADFLSSYERLYLLDMHESKWQEAADASSRVLRRNPYDFPGAYYVNAMANLQLQNLDAAERSAREAGRLQGDSVEPRANYILGLVLARQGHTEAAIETLQAFIGTSPSGAEQKDAERIVANLETRMRNRAAQQKQ
jgi:tetratricopeptide (TPR) repeat protein